MAKRIRIYCDGVEAVAALHEDAAPVTVARLLAALPIEQTLRHLRWGGDAGYIMVSRLADSSQPLENPVTFYPPGTIGFRREHGEIAICYGQAQARSHVQMVGWACNLATLETNAGALLEKIHATRSEGGKPIRFVREE